MMAFIRKAEGTCPVHITADPDRLTCWPQPEEFWAINRMLERHEFNMIHDEGFPMNAMLKIERTFGRGYLSIRLEFTDGPLTTGVEGTYITFMIHNPE